MKKQILTLALLTGSLSSIAQRHSRTIYSSTRPTRMAFDTLEFNNKFQDSISKYEDINEYYQYFGNDTQKQKYKPIIERFVKSQDSLLKVSRRNQWKNDLETKYKIKLD